jgi:hypothetical protein
LGVAKKCRVHLNATQNKIEKNYEHPYNVYEMNLFKFISLVPHTKYTTIDPQLKSSKIS